MERAIKKLKMPLKQGDIKKLKAGDLVVISGTILTARDRAHARILDFLENGKKLPFELDDSVIYHCGPLMRKDRGWEVVTAGPTTSSRMNRFTPKLLALSGVRAIIGKGGMNDDVVGKMRNHAVYLAFTGGCAALAVENIKKVKAVHWLEFGIPEAVWELEVEEFGPLLVAIDMYGNNLYDKIKA